MKRSRLLFWCVCVLSLIPVVGRVQASTLGLSASPGSGSVLFSGSELIQGNGANAITLSVPGAGELFLTLTDLNFPDPFASLNFSLSNAQTALFGVIEPGSVSLGVAGPATLYADVFATTQSGFDLGLYNLTATFVSAAPVNLPATGGLLTIVTMLAVGLELLCKRRTQTTVTTAVA
jgi:hypothetical protein